MYLYSPSMKHLFDMINCKVVVGNEKMTKLPHLWSSVIKQVHKAFVAIIFRVVHET